MSNDETVRKIHIVDDQEGDEQTDGQDSATAELLRQIQQELEETKDRYLRALADLQNLKKKTAHERHEAREKGMIAIVEELLPILDNFERAETAFEQGGNIKSLREGVDLIFNQLKTSLQKKGLEPLESFGKQFDPHYHEAIGRIPTTDIADGHVAQEVQKGYRFGARIIRPSRVMVATKPEE